jgi:spore coat polysaccharide biosynthesis protein SpsF (cytidylyltransferase family)
MAGVREYKKICAVVQATYQSDLFPGKSMTKIAGKTVLEHIVSRIKKVKSVSEIILATSDTSPDDSLVEEAKRLNIKIFRGSTSDVLNRLCGAVQRFNGETILKVNGNYPLFDPYLANDPVNKHLKGGFESNYTIMNI